MSIAMRALDLPFVFVLEIRVLVDPVIALSPWRTGIDFCECVPRLPLFTEWTTSYRSFLGRQRAAALLANAQGGRENRQPPRVYFSTVASGCRVLYRLCQTSLLSSFVSTTTAVASAL